MLNPSNIWLFQTFHTIHALSVLFEKEKRCVYSWGTLKTHSKEKCYISDILSIIHFDNIVGWVKENFSDTQYMAMIKTVIIEEITWIHIV